MVSQGAAAAALGTVLGGFVVIAVGVAIVGVGLSQMGVPVNQVLSEINFK